MFQTGYCIQDSGRAERRERRVFAGGTALSLLVLAALLAGCESSPQQRSGRERLMAPTTSAAPRSSHFI